MGKDRICNGCANNNNGWCKARKTNKGLRDLTSCEFRKDDSLLKLENYCNQKKFELEFEDSDFNKGIIRGLEIALKIMKDK